MCNYTEYLKQKQEINDMLKILARMETRHFSDSQIIDLLEIDLEKLKSLREMLQEKCAAVMAD